MYFYTLIIPVYNRPNEVDELLDSLTKLRNKNFEVVIIEDGSDITCEETVNKYSPLLNIKYQIQENTGPGPARNHGGKLAKGDYLIFLDSDVIVPKDYLDSINKYIQEIPLDCFGGPDKAHDSFTPAQKAINYSMTSPLTTGGIRGSQEKMDRFYPRSFNLGIKKRLFNEIEGFSSMRFGEDLDLSMRIIEKGYKTGLIKDAYVYHKRRNNFKSFFKQVFNSGIARINLEKRHPNTLKLVHLLPTAFVAYLFSVVLLSIINYWILIGLILPGIIFIFDALFRTKEFKTAYLSAAAVYTQFIGYGTGFLKAYWIRIVLKKNEFHSFKKNFYK